MAVFGSQSTGKSTLLNRLFQTDFDVMQDSARKQTTRGVWLSRAKELPIIVMDVEGTDGRERGEDQEFERRSALFSMAVAEVIIINLWENMVGLYNGANMGLLKTVFEVNLQLFRHENRVKTLLFFCIRDFIGQTPLENLERVMMDSLHGIWKELSKPAGLEQAKLEDFFDFMFATLPHKLLQPKDFDSAAVALQQRFNNRNDKNYVFQKIYHKNIPSDGFAIYAKSIWAKIIESKDLDLPTQQQLLAQYRCDEIMVVVYDKFLSGIKSIGSSLSHGEVSNDFQSLSKNRSEALEAFSKDASRYHQDVYVKKKKELFDKLNAKLYVLFNDQIKNARKKAIADFKTTVHTILTKDGGENFASKLVDAQTAAETYFETKLKEARLSDTHWKYEEDIKSFNLELDELSSKIRVDEMDKITKRLEKAALKSIVEFISSTFTSCPRDMWSQILSGYRRYLDSALNKFAEKAKGFRATEEEIRSSKQSMETSLWEGFRSKIRDEVSEQMLQVRLKKKFEDLFRYTEEGLPRVWNEKDNIEDCFVKAKDVALDLIALFAKIPIPEELVDEFLLDDEDYDKDASAIVLLSVDRQQELKDRLKRDAELVFMEAKRGAVASLSEIPMPVWALLFILGFNEITSLISFMISNPFLLILAVIAASALFTLHKSGTLMPALKLAMQSAKPAAKIAMASAAPALQAAGEYVATSLQEASKQLRPEGKEKSSVTADTISSPNRETRKKTE